MTGMTVFAPTNAAFDKSDPAWRVTATPGVSDRGGADAFNRQGLIRQAELAGVHPVSAFAGTVRDVRAVGGRVFHVDGRTPGAITITTGAVAVTGLGFTEASGRSARVEFPVIPTRNGFIYPVDGIIVR